MQDPEELVKALQQESLAKLVLRYMRVVVVARKLVTWAPEAQTDMEVLVVARTARLTRATAILLLQTQAVAAEVLRVAIMAIIGAVGVDQVLLSSATSGHKEDNNG